MDKKVLLENPSKGKLEMILGSIGMFGGLALGVGGCFNSLAEHHPQDCKNYLTAGGVIFGVSAVYHLYGKLKHWYHNG